MGGPLIISVLIFSAIATSVTYKSTDTFSDRWFTKTKSSVVAVIADRTAFDVLYTGKLSSITSLRTAGTHDPIQRIKFMNAPKRNPLKREH